MNKILYKLAGITIVLLSTALFTASCTKDVDKKSIGAKGQVGFSVTSSAPQPQSRAEDGSKACGEAVKEIQMECSSDVGEDGPIMYLQTYISDIEADTYGAITKGSVLDKNSFMVRYKTAGFGAFAYQYDGNFSDYTYVITHCSSLLTQRMGTASSGTKVTYDIDKKLWRGNADLSAWGNDKMAFFAYAPFTAPDGVTMSVNEKDRVPTISYTDPADPAKQIDLLYARTVDLKKPADNIIPLTFEHALTAIVFNLGSKFKSGKIISIALRNVKNSGVFDMNTQTWTLNDELKDFTLDINKSYTTEEAQAKPLISGEDEVVFMMPQTFQDNTAILEVKYAESSDLQKVYTLTAPLCHTGDWQKGKQVVYTLSPSIEGAINAKFEVSDIPDITYEGARDIPIAVTSQLVGKQSGEIIKDKVPWSVEYSTDEGVNYSSTAPDWLKITRDEATGNALVTVRPQVPTTVVSSIGGTGWSAERGTSVSPYNLSNATGDATIENTANCYIVNGPGWYKFPLVYGNSATKIASPDKVRIAWQDAGSEVISDVALCDNNTFIRFYISPESISYDNAVVEVNGASGEKLWSWHLWVTPYRLGADEFSYKSSGNGGDGVTRFFMPYNLGYIPAYIVTTTTTMTYTKRSCVARFTISVNSGSIIEQYIVQDSYNPAPASTQVSYPERSLYYQWGNREPMASPGTVASGSSSATAWHSGLSGNDDKGVANGKTINDPSPVGYCVPNSYAFGGITTSDPHTFNVGRYWSAVSLTCFSFGDTGMLYRESWTGSGCFVRSVRESGDIIPDKDEVDVDDYSDKGDVDPDLNVTN